MLNSFHSRGWLAHSTIFPLPLDNSSPTLWVSQFCRLLPTSFAACYAIQIVISSSSSAPRGRYYPMQQRKCIPIITSDSQAESAKTQTDLPWWHAFKGKSISFVCILWEQYHTIHMREICVWRLLLCNWSIDCKMSFPVMTYCRPQQTRQWFISLLSQKDLQVEIPIPSSFIEMLATKGNGNPLEGLRGRHDMPHYGVWKWKNQAAIMWRETKPWTIGRFEAAVAVYYPSEMRTPIWNLLSLLYSSMTWNDGRYISPEDVLRQTFQGPPPKLLFHSRETTVGMVVCCMLVVAFTTEAANFMSLSTCQTEVLRVTWQAGLELAGNEDVMTEHQTPLDLLQTPSFPPDPSK